MDEKCNIEKRKQYEPTALRKYIASVFGRRLTVYQLPEERKRLELGKSKHRAPNSGDVWTPRYYRQCLKKGDVPVRREGSNEDSMEWN